MRAWIILFLCLAGKALAAPEEAVAEVQVVEETEQEELIRVDLQMLEINHGTQGASRTQQAIQHLWEKALPVGANPVQIATGDFEETDDDTKKDIETENPCENFHCKRGKICEADENDEPMCVCQNPSTCPPSTVEFEKVCGTDNNTYDSACQLFATKCALEGTKKGHKLHLDYIGPCKFIQPCQDGELAEFPLRMRDWLKNVLVTLYERDNEQNNLLTEKQKMKVKKMYENEKRLQAGEHSVDLLAHDFEKNYNMFIFPVHWQFGQLDQHPADKYLSHSELAPLRAPLVPMEHCTTRFFQQCDADNDKYIALEEWAMCFGIKDEDIDGNLLI